MIIAPLVQGTPLLLFVLFGWQSARFTGPNSMFVLGLPVCKILGLMFFCKISGWSPATVAPGVLGF